MKEPIEHGIKPECKECIWFLNNECDLAIIPGVRASQDAQNDDGSCFYKEETKNK